MKHDVVAQVAGLPDLPASELHAMWEALFNETTPRNRQRAYLISRLAWRIQELAYGGFTPEGKMQLEQSIQTPIAKKSTRVQRPTIGTVLIREHDNIEHRVTVTREGFEYQGRTYRSLSQIARDITGTRWSGPAFFGLKKGNK